VILARNTATGNSAEGFLVVGPNATHLVIDNVSANNSTGIAMIYHGPSRVTGNTFSSNSVGSLFQSGPPGDFAAAGPLVARNTIVGSSVFALQVFTDGSFAAPRFKENNLSGHSHLCVVSRSAMRRLQRHVIDVRCSQ
jgi:nitrous oxidase accessory protein NosD